MLRGDTSRRICATVNKKDIPGMPEKPTNFAYGVHQRIQRKGVRIR